MIRILAFLSALFLASSLQAQGQYRLQEGDVLQIEVLEDSSLNRQTFVLPDGRVSVPLIGTIPAGGRTLGQVQQIITTRLAPNFVAPPTVFVSLLTLAPEEEDETIDVYVQGEVASPGKRQVEAGTNVLQFLAEMGAFTKFAATKRVQLRRVVKGGKVQQYVINYKAIERGSTIRNLITLREGDVIVVPQRRLFE